jgi:hypothetical protein
MRCIARSSLSVHFSELLPTMRFSSILPSLLTTLSFAVGIDAWAQVRSSLSALVVV